MATRIAGRDAHGLSRRTAQTGLLVAAFVVPQSFASSLTPRSWTDQGIITGLDTTLNYLLTATTQDVVEAAAGGVAPRLSWLRAAPPPPGNERPRSYSTSRSSRSGWPPSGRSPE